MPTHLSFGWEIDGQSITHHDLEVMRYLVSRGYDL